MKIQSYFPVGGLGTRFLPATKAMPKEMLPIVDKPLIQYVVDEAMAVGIEELIFVTGRNKTAIEDHFDHSSSLKQRWLRKEKIMRQKLSRYGQTVGYGKLCTPAGTNRAWPCCMVCVTL